MGTAELALQVNKIAAKKILHLKSPLKVVSCCDNSKKCRKVLAASTDEKCHVFQDVMAYIRSSSWRVDRAKSFESLVKYMEGCKESTTAWCDKHKDLCAVSCHGDVDVSGSPCVDWSRAGKRLGLHGPTLRFAVSWGLHHRHSGTRVVIHENVQQFDTQVVEQALGPRYIYHHCAVSTKDIGWGHVCARDRLPERETPSAHTHTHPT